MTAKDYLYRLSEYSEDIRSLEREVNVWESLAKSKSDESLQKAKKELQEKISVQRNALEYILASMRKLPAIENDVLMMRYIGVDCDSSGELKILTLQEIADKHHKSYTWVTTVQSRALKHLQKIFDEDGFSETL